MLAENIQPKKPSITRFWWIGLIIFLAIVMVVALVVLFIMSGQGPNNQNKDNSNNNSNDPRNSDIVATFTPDSKTAFQYNPPTIVDNSIYVGTSTKIGPDSDPTTTIAALPDSFFYKLDLDLNIIWQHPLGKAMVGGAGVLDSDGNIYFSTLEYKPAPAGKTNTKGFLTDIYLYSINGNGEFRWKYKISTAEEEWDHGMVNLAISPDDTIYVGDSKFFAFNKSGTLKWQYPTNDDFFVGNRSGPSIDNSGNVYFVSPEPSKSEFGSGQLNVYRFDSGSSTPTWISRLPSVAIVPQEGGGTEVRSTYGVPAFNSDFTRVIVTGANTVYTLDKSTGNLIWSFKPDGIVGLFKASIAIDKDNNIFVGSKANEDSVFYAIKGDGSGLLWEYATGADMYPSPLIGDDNRVYFGSENSSNGHLHAIDIATGQLVWNTGYDKGIMVDFSFGSPALYNGYIYAGAFSVTDGGVSVAAFYKVKVNATNYQPGAVWPRFHGSNDSNGRKGIASITDTTVLSMIAPYINESDVSSVNEAYSMDANNPYWGFVHPGVDFMITKPFIPVQAAVSGTIVNFAIEKSTGIMGWHAGFCIEFNPTYSICYNLESFGNTDEVGQRVTDAVFFKNGDYVEQGQYIANLIYGGSGSHIDFGIGTAGTRICPEPFFTDEARESVMRLIRIKQPNWPMCDS